MMVIKFHFCYDNGAISSDKSIMKTFPPAREQMATSLKAVTYEEGLKNQKERAEKAKAEIALMSKGSPEQFKAQCERLKAQRRQSQD